MIDLRSDTVTRPTEAMRQAIATAEVGDDMLAEDPTVNRLEAMTAEMFGAEAAVFACSATQANQMAVRTHCLPGDELLINSTGHIANFEGGAPAALSGVTARTIVAPQGKLDLGDLEGKVRADDQHYCRTRLVCLENTTNLGGGFAYDLDQLERVSAWSRDNGLKLHLDGARFFNACTVKGYKPAEVGPLFDTISICASKGLGCPMGSLLIGDALAIKQARRSRKIFGGALRQAGIVAAAVIHAFENHIDRLADDHANAKLLANGLAAIDGVSLDADAIESNLVFFEIDAELGRPAQLAAQLVDRGIRVGPLSGQMLRVCTHLDVTTNDIHEVVNAVRECCAAGFSEVETVSSGPYGR